MKKPIKKAGALAVKKKHPFTQERIDALKKEHGTIYVISAACEDADDIAFMLVKHPELEDWDLFTAMSQGSQPVSAYKELGESIFLEGDRRPLDDKRFIQGMIPALDRLVVKREASLEKL